MYCSRHFNLKIFVKSQCQNSRNKSAAKISYNINKVAGFIVSFLECSQPSIFSAYFYLIVEREGIARKLDASAKRTGFALASLSFSSVCASIERLWTVFWLLPRHLFFTLTYITQVNSTFRARWLASSEVISQVLFISEQPKKNKMAFVGMSQIKFLFGPLIIQLVWYTVKQLFAAR